MTCGKAGQTKIRSKLLLLQTDARSTHLVFAAGGACGHDLRAQIGDANACVVVAAKVTE
jgi:hypothetical protein